MNMKGGSGIAVPHFEHMDLLIALNGVATLSAATHKCQNTTHNSRNQQKRKCVCRWGESVVMLLCVLNNNEPFENREHCAAKPQQWMKGLCQTTHTLLSALLYSLRLAVRAIACIEIGSVVQEMWGGGDNGWPKNQVTLNAIRAREQKMQIYHFLRLS